MIENLRMWIPYNQLIGNRNHPCTCPVEIIEEWDHVIGFEGIYKISSFGRAISLKRRTINNILLEERFLSQRLSERGYLSVNLSFPRDTTKFIHIIVAECFVPNPDNKPIVNHLNGNKIDPIFFNLRWSTYSENTKHSYEIGTSVAISHPEQCKPVFDADMGIFYESLREAAMAFGVCKSTIARRAKSLFNDRFMYI